MNSNQPAGPRRVNCPRCGQATIWHETNPHRPFCSERCKLIDLGQWATGGYRIPQAEDDAVKPDEA